MAASDYERLEIISLGFGAPLDMSLVGEIEKLASAEKGGNYEFYEEFDVSGKKQYLICTVSKSKKPTPHLHFTTIGGRGRLGIAGSAPSTTKLFELLVGQPQTTLQCNVKFIFKKRKRIHSIIALPITVSNRPDSAFTEIRGMHVYREATPSTPEVNVIFDTDREDELYLSVDFSQTFQWSPSTPDDIVESALTIAEGFVMLEPKNAAKTK